jgi:hypothetical protein
LITTSGYRPDARPRNGARLIYNLVEFVLAVCIVGMLVVDRAEVTGFLERSGILNTASARYKILFGTLPSSA